LTSALISLEQRVGELTNEGLDVMKLGELLAKGEWHKGSGIQEKGESFYRGARGLLAAQDFSGLAAFDWCYQSVHPSPHDSSKNVVATWCISYFMHNHQCNETFTRTTYPHFAQTMARAIALLKSCVSEFKSRELPIKTELSSLVVRDEFQMSREIFDSSDNETFLRVSGVIAGVALERHFRTVAEERNVTIIKNPPTKAHSDFSEVVLALRNAKIVT
jgi:hypothetical protein